MLKETRVGENKPVSLQTKDYWANVNKSGETMRRWSAGGDNGVTNNL